MGRTVKKKKNYCTAIALNHRFTSKEKFPSISNDVK